jgi:hypothetical protein
MPIFLDRHDVVEVSAEEVAKLHVKDLEVQGKYSTAECADTSRNSPQQFRDFLVSDTARWVKLMEDTGARLD